MAAEVDEASIVRSMFGTNGSDDEEQQEEEKYPTANQNGYNGYNGYSDTEETDGKQFRGLKNQGATCYLNALLQSLYFTPELREGIYKLSEKELGICDIEEADKLDEDIKNNKYPLNDEDIAMLSSLGYTTTRAKRALVKAENEYEKAKNLLKSNGVPSVKRILIKLREFFSLLSASSESSVSTKELTDAFGWVSREVRVQHDAHELNRILIDAIERSLATTSNQELINSIYLGQMVSRTLCLKCEYCSERKENFLDAIIQVQNIASLSHSLSKQCKSEYLVGENQYFCEKCNAKCDAKRSVAYTKLPKVLTLALNRFVFNLYTMNREKCNDRFEFPLVFDFEPYLDEQLSNTQTHRTKKDEELLKKANQEYENEQKLKQQAKEKREKIEKEEKEKEKEKEKEPNNNNNNKQQLAITAPPNITNTQITKGTHTEIAPLPQPQPQPHPNPNHNGNGNGNGNNNNNGISAWRSGIPRSMSEEDEDVKRAIAESLGQEYVAPHPASKTYGGGNGNMNISGIDSMNSMNRPHGGEMQMALKEEVFEAQELVSYDSAVEMLLNGHCCFGLYDKKIKQWRTAVFMKKWDDKKRLMVRFSQDGNINPSAASDKFLTIKDFPIDCIINDVERFNVKERDLRDMSNVPPAKVDLWLQRKNKNKNNHNHPLNNNKQSKQEKDKKAKAKQAKEKENEKENEKEKEKEKEEKEEKEKKEKEEKEKETETEKEEEEEEEEEEEKVEDWSKRTDFAGITSVGFLCNNGEVIQGDCLRHKANKIFVHFGTDASHFGKKYDWISTPNERLCPPPKNRVKQEKAICLAQEMTTYSSNQSHKYDMYDYGTRDESSVMPAAGSNTAASASASNRYKARHYNWKLSQPKINLDSKHLYALTGVVIHRGTPHAGHYHAYLKDFMTEREEKEEKAKEEKAKEIWYDFNDSAVYRIPVNKVAQQYGGSGSCCDECAYMLVYRKMSNKSLPDVSLPNDLVEYVKKMNIKIKQEKEKREAKQNQMTIQIVHPNCFQINEGKLTMNPFIECLLKKIITLSREKKKIDKVINNKKNEEEEEEKEKETEELKECEISINKLYLEREWPTNMNAIEIDKIVQEHYKQNSIFIKCDAREPISTLMKIIHDKLPEIGQNLQLHILSIPSTFDDINIDCHSIYDLFDSNIAGNVDDRIYPILNLEMDEDDKDKNDDQYPYQRMPEKIGDLPFKKLDFLMNSRACFVWNGIAINGIGFNLKISRTIKLAIKYFKDDRQIIGDTVIIGIEASLHEIWLKIGEKLNISDIKSPVFTLLTSAPRDWPDIIYFNSDHRGPYDYEFYSKPKFAKLLHHKINAMKRWRANKGRRNRSNSDPDRNMDRNRINQSRHHNFYQNDSFFGDPILCVENSLNLPQPSRDTIASQQWHESTKFSTISIDDYTQLDTKEKEKEEEEEEEEKKEEKEYKKNINMDDVGSSNLKNALCRKLTWKIPKGTSLEKFFEIARDRCSIDSGQEIRAFRVYESDRYLITFPYKFQCKQHKLILERGRYPKFSEVFLMVCLINADNSSPSFLPLIVDKCKSVKFVKQSILSLFNVSPLNYKKYVCYNITTSIHSKDKCWRDALTLNNNAINPRHGDRIGLQIGVDTINKKISIIKDTRNLTKVWDLSGDSGCYTNNFVNAAKNPYIEQEIGTISIAGDCSLQQLRKQIYCMQEFKNGDIKSYKYLLLSWIDQIYRVPLSFPMIKSGKLAQQKNFTSNRSVICVEILNDEIEAVAKTCRFLHLHLAKVISKDIDNGNDKDNDILYWPPDHHIRLMYNEENSDSKQDKITHKQLCQFLCGKYNILSENIFITMFKVNKGEWVVIDEQTDNNKQGLVGAPYHIQKTNRHGQIFAIFDLLQCDIKNIDNGNNKEKINFIQENMNKWGPPPLSNKAAFFYKHLNNKHSSINDISKGINSRYSSYDRQLKINILD